MARAAAENSLPLRAPETLSSRPPARGDAAVPGSLDSDAAACLARWMPTPRSADVELAILERDDAVEAVGQLEIVGRDQRGEAAGADDLDEDLRDARRCG